MIVVVQARKDQLVLQSDCEPASHQVFDKVFVIGQPSRGLFYVHSTPRNGRGLKIVSRTGECSTPSLSKRGCMPRGEMEDVSGGGAVRAKI